jgi:hypothetical protein
VSKQSALFETPLFLPEGLRYTADFVSPEIEQQLVSAIRGHPYPVPLKVYDETIRVMKSAVLKA